MIDHLPGFLKHLLKVADDLENDAGHSGAHHDGGARDLRTQVEVYQAGQSNMIPRVWESRWDDYIKTKDAEWAEYQRLKLKFEARR